MNHPSLILANHLRAVLIPNVERSTAMQFVLVLLIILALLQIVDRNVWLIQNVNWIELVIIKNVEILVLELAELTRDVKSSIIIQFAAVSTITLEILSLAAFSKIVSNFCFFAVVHFIHLYPLFSPFPKFRETSRTRSRKSLCPFPMRSKFAM